MARAAVIDEVVPVNCPCCGAQSTITVDASAGARQEFTQDCPVCCQPWVVKVTVRRGRPEVVVEPE